MLWPFYQRLRAIGKPSKAALVAAMHKVPLILKRAPFRLNLLLGVLTLDPSFPTTHRVAAGHIVVALFRQFCRSRGTSSKVALFTRDLKPLGTGLGGPEMDHPSVVAFPN